MFFIKKVLLDLRNNVLCIAALNSGFILIAAAAVFCAFVFGDFPIIKTLITFIWTISIFVYTCASALTVSKLSVHSGFGIVDFKNNLRLSLKTGIIFGTFSFVVFFGAAFAVSFYVMLNTFAGLLISCFIFWLFAALLTAFQFFPAVFSNTERTTSKLIKRTLVFFIGNLPFCLLTFFLSLLFLVLSAITLLLFPGPAGILLFLDEGFRAREKRNLRRLTGFEGACKLNV